MVQKKSTKVSIFFLHLQEMKSQSGAAIQVQHKFNVTHLIIWNKKFTLSSHLVLKLFGQTEQGCGREPE